MDKNRKGVLYLIPTPLGAEADIEQIPTRVRQLVRSLKGFIVESKKSALQFLKKVEYPIPLRTVPIRILDEHTRSEEWSGLLMPLEEGESWGLMSEVGSPAIADPGAGLIRLAYDRGIRVSPQTGPSAILLALMASGLNGQRFAFHGYLSKDRSECRRQLVQLEIDAARFDRTQIWIETPYRNLALFEDMISSLKDETDLSISIELNCPTEEIYTKSIERWKREPRPHLKNRPTIFLLGVRRSAKAIIR